MLTCTHTLHTRHTTHLPRHTTCTGAQWPMAASQTSLRTQDPTTNDGPPAMCSNIECGRTSHEQCASNQQPITNGQCVSRVNLKHACMHAVCCQGSMCNVQWCFPAVHCLHCIHIHTSRNLPAANGQRSCPPVHSTINVFGLIVIVFLMNKMTVLSSMVPEGDNCFPCKVTTNAGRKIPLTSIPVEVCSSIECDHWPTESREKVDPS